MEKIERNPEERMERDGKERRRDFVGNDVRRSKAKDEGKNEGDMKQ